MTSNANRLAAPTSYARDLVDAARDNPVSTALIGMGLMWMVIGGNATTGLRRMRDLGGTAAASLGAGGHRVVDGVTSRAASASDTVSAALDAVAETASGLEETAKQRSSEVPPAMSTGSGLTGSVKGGLDAAGRSAGDVAASAKSTASRMSSQASDGAVDFVITLRDGFADLLDRQPLVLGALGLAVGAGVAAALPSLAAEEVMGGTLDGLRSSVREGISGAYSRAAEEARAQGLTLDAATDAVSDIGNKVAEIAKVSAGDAVSSVAKTEAADRR